MGIKEPQTPGFPRYIQDRQKARQRLGLRTAGVPHLKFWGLKQRRWNERRLRVRWWRRKAEARALQVGMARQEAFKTEIRAEN